MQLAYAGALPSQWTPSFPQIEIPPEILRWYRAAADAYDETRAVTIDFGSFLKTEPWIWDGLRLGPELLDFPLRYAELRSSAIYAEDSKIGAGRVVPLVPGLGAFSSTMRPLHTVLSNHGYASSFVDLGERFNIACPDRTARRLVRQIREMCEQNGGPIDAIGHSLGGLILRALKEAMPHRFRRVYTLGSPWLAALLEDPKSVNAWVRWLYRLLGVIRKVRDNTDIRCAKMECRCRMREKLIESGARPAHASGVIPIASPYDRIVAYKTAFRPGEPVVTLSYGGHVGLPANVEAVSFIVNDLQDLALAA